MHAILKRTLFFIAAAIVVLDVLLLAFGHYRIDGARYALLLLLAPPLIGASAFYSRKRDEPTISATLACAAFLMVFSVATCLSTYLMLPLAGPRADAWLAGIDHAMGFSWVAVMTIAADHRFITWLLKYIYLSVMPQTFVLLLLLGWKNQSRELYGFCLALSLGAIIAIAAWTAFPSFGAFSVFNLPPEVARKLGLALGGDYGHDLVNMLKNGPGLISPAELRGIIGFPSYHTVQALVLIWYARKLAYVRWLSLALNVAVLIATPVHGGHHLIDIFGGMAVTLAAIALADTIVARAARRGPATSRALHSGAAQSAPA